MRPSLTMLVAGPLLAGALLAGSGCSDKHATSGDPSSSGGPPVPASAKVPVRVTLPTTPWPAQKQALHVLNRLAFGPRPGELEAVTKQGVAKWVGAQLRPAGIPDEALETKLRALPAVAMDVATLERTYPRAPKPAGTGGSPARPPGSTTFLDLLPQVLAQKMLRATESERQLQEVLVDFWFNHFNVLIEKDRVRWYALPYERDAIRPHVFGRFRELLGAVAHHPAMLYYSDNWLSAAEQAPAPGKKPQGLNENYGRALLEVHTVGVDSGYKQDDVNATVRAFTGWGIEDVSTAAAFAFHAGKHDKGPKVVLGKSFDAGGEADGEQVLDLLAAHPATAHHLALELCQKFVGDHPAPALVERVAGVFTKSAGDLTQVYEAIFTAPEFWSDASFRTKTKTPLTLVASALRAVGAATSEGFPVAHEVDKLDEVLYRCAPPSGYRETADAWVSTGGLIGRINFGIALGAARVRGTTFDRDKLVGTPFPTTDEALVDELAGSVLHWPVSAATRATIVHELAASASTPYHEPKPTAVPLALGLLLGSPEMQKQ